MNAFMAGKEGYSHNCNGRKINPIQEAPSLMGSGLTHAQCNIIWDFYVTHAVGNQNTLRDVYGWDLTQNKTCGLPALEEQLAQAAGIESFCLIKNNTIKDTLNAMNLTGSQICIEHPRAVMKQEFDVICDENENITLKPKENRPACILRHVRNALAHGNVYCYDNGMLLMRDKETDKKISAVIVILSIALLKWIRVIDKNNIRHYDLSLFDDEI